jgi:hypothetical protein
MVIAPRQTPMRAGWMVVELMAALTILLIAMIPLAYSFHSEKKLLRAHYNQAVAMEIIDGEIEILHAGQWRQFTEGEQPYPITAEAATNLPPGAFLLTRTTNMLRLQWRPLKKNTGGIVSRETAIPH